MQYGAELAPEIVANIGSGIARGVAYLIRDWTNERYLKLRSIRLLKAELTRDGIVSKVRVSKKGNQSGGQLFGRGALYELLANPIYLGEIRHRKVRHPGQQRAIVDQAVWEQVQAGLRKQAAHHRTLDAKGVSSPLAGKLFDENGEPLYACGAKRVRAVTATTSRAR